MFIEILKQIELAPVIYERKRNASENEGNGI
jgi:hypothetical protein